MGKVFRLVIAFLLYCFIAKAVPVFTNFAYTTNTCSTTSKTFSITISDASAIASGSLTPRVYYRKNLGSFTSTTGTLTAGTFTNGTWTFTMPFLITSGDFIYFYVVAQNISGNVQAYPNAGFAATDVNTIISDSKDPLGFYYGLLNGTYTVGNGGNFPRLTDAALAYSTECGSVFGPVTFILTDSLYSPATGEVFPIVFTSRFGASATNSLLIKPATGNTAIVRSDTIASSVIKFANTKYFTLDGFNGTGSGLKIYLENRANNPISAIYLAGNPPTVVGCSNGVIRNTIVNGASFINYGFFSSGILIGGDATFNPGGAVHNNIDINSNQIYRSVNGINAQGNSANSLGHITGLTISSNTIGPSSTTQTLNIITNAGIEVNFATAPIISQNIIQNCVSSGFNSYYVNSMSVLENTIRCIGDSLMNRLNPVFGMQFINGTSGTVQGNTINNVKNFSAGKGVKGISCTGALGIKIYNNMISDISNSGANANHLSWPVGIYLNSTGGPDVANNTVSLFGSHSSTTGAMGSANLMIDGAYFAWGPTTTWRNNIFNNTYDHSSSLNDTSYAVYVPPSSPLSPPYSSCDNNIYNVGGPGCPGVLAQEYNINRKTISDMKLAFGGHMNSYTATPVFSSVNDLHLVTNLNPAMDNTGAPITYIIDDFDHQLRNTSNPDIGADEFTNTSPCISALYGSITTTSLTACHGQTVALNFGGPPSGTGYLYQWKFSPTPGGPYTNVTGGSGATTPSYTTPPLSGGPTNYYYVLEKTCASASLSAISNEATVTILPLPTASITAFDTLLCPNESLFLAGSSDMSWNSATIYNWTGPGTYTNNTINAFLIPTLYSNSSSGTLYFTVTYGACTSSVASISYSITPNYTSAITISPSATVCPGTTISLVAFGPGVVSYTWNPYGVQSPTLTVLALTGTYFVYSTDINACNYTTTAFVVAHPDVGITTSPTGITCVGSGQTFTLNAGAATSYSWNTMANTQSIVVSPSVTTSYTVNGTSNYNCPYSSVSTITVSTCTTINETENQEFLFSISPNPNNGNFMVSIKPDLYNGRLKLFNVLGQLILEQEIISDKTEVHLKDPPKGIYYFTFENDKQQIYSGKLLIE